MCNRLLQTYACGHSKSICTTPCGHALKSTQAATSSNPPTVVRSKPTVSSTVQVSHLPSRNFSRPDPSNHSPLRVTNISSATSSPTHVSAFRIVPPSTPSPSSSVSPVSPSFASSSPSSRFPTPSPSCSKAKELEVEPSFCSYYIPRHLTKGTYPCIECFGKSEWEELRTRWMDNYRLGHPLDRGEHVEALSGVEGVLERAV